MLSQTPAWRYLVVPVSLKQGITASIVASCFFALLPIYVQFSPSQGAAAGHFLATQRVLWSVVLMLGVLGFSKELCPVWQRLKQIKQWPVYALSAALVGLQFWLFIWAPVNGETLNVALGYFSLPLTLVLVGRLVYQERLRPLQQLAVLIAGLGVAYAYALADGLSWVVFAVALGYPPYFMLRKKLGIPAKQAFFLDNLLLAPPAIYVMLQLSGQLPLNELPLSDWIYYAGLGVLGTIPMLLFLFASRSLPMSLFGLLGYVEPVLVFMVGLALGERISAEQLPSYLLIMLALAFLATDLVKQLRQSH